MTPFIQDETVFVDNSAIEAITLCPTLGYYKLLRRRILNIPQPARRFGQHIHSALAYRYRCESHGIKWTEATQMRILERLFSRNLCENEDWRNLDMACKVIHHYNEEYDLNNFDIVKINERSMVELPFAYELGRTRAGMRVIHIGRIDLVVHHQNGWLVVDHKTTSRLGDSYWLDAAMSEQGRGYCNAVKECCDNEPLGYTINCLAVREPTKSGVSIEFAQQTTYTKFPEGQLDEWKENFLAQIDTFLWHNYNEFFPRHHHMHCIHKYGRCEYYNVCSLPKSNREAALASEMYRENDWTPLRKHKDI